MDTSVGCAGVARTRTGEGFAGEQRRARDRSEGPEAERWRPARERASRSQALRKAAAGAQGACDRTPRFAFWLAC